MANMINNIMANMVGTIDCHKITSCYRSKYDWYNLSSHNKLRCRLLIVQVGDTDGVEDICEDGLDEEGNHADD